jgi:hypothetical protein
MNVINLSFNLILEMSNIRLNIDNFQYYVYFSKLNSNKKENFPRIKISNSKKAFDKLDNFTILVNTPNLDVIGNCKLSNKELNKIKQWIFNNKENLIKYWNDSNYKISELTNDLK